MVPSKHETTSFKKQKKVSSLKKKRRGQLHFSLSKEQEEGEKKFHRYKLKRIAQTYNVSKIFLEFRVATERCYPR